MSFERARGRPTKILVLNPNSSKAMTDGMKTVIDAVDLPYSTEVYTYTGPADAPASINDDEDIEQSTKAVLEDLDDSDFRNQGYDGVLVACFSVHPLVANLQTDQSRPVAITGIFEASVLAAVSLLRRGETWGIVTTGKFWEEHLDAGVLDFLGVDRGAHDSKFVGVVSTGLNASDFHHGVDPEVVRKKLKEATQHLFRKKGLVTCIVMGCAGMAGLEEIIRSAVSELAGNTFAYSMLHVIDGVRAGIMQVDNMIRHQRLRPGKS
ncbi:Asp/Glu/hydantoin racemase [Hypoxylon cercidicola]|nr:Asp/Glu/hydantoin racemase [Hypoxylon cercidicola]